jgi:hypothetical protein
MDTGETDDLWLCAGRIASSDTLMTSLRLGFHCKFAVYLKIFISCLFEVKDILKNNLDLKI